MGSDLKKISIILVRFSKFLVTLHLIIFSFMCQLPYLGHKCPLGFNKKFNFDRLLMLLPNQLCYCNTICNTVIQTIT